MTDLAKRTIERRFMRDSCRIERPARRGKGTLDKVSGQVTTPNKQVIYEGPCSIVAATGSRETTEGDAESRTSRWVVKIPGFDEAPRNDDEITMGNKSHPAVSGIKLTVDRALMSTEGFGAVLEASRVVPSVTRGVASS